MKHIINIGEAGNFRIFIRNRWNDAFSFEWNLINVGRRKLTGRTEYIFSLIGFEFCFMQDTDF